MSGEGTVSEDSDEGIEQDEDSEAVSESGASDPGVGNGINLLDPVDLYIGVSLGKKDPLDTLKELDPFVWWKERMECMPQLKDLGVLACMLLTHPITSAFSERIFSYDGEQSSGKRSSISLKRLTARALCKLNYSLVPKEGWYNVTARMEEILKSNTDLGYRVVSGVLTVSA